MKPHELISRIREAKTIEERLLIAAGMGCSDFDLPTIDSIVQLARCQFFLSKHPKSRPKEYADRISQDLARFGYKIAYRIEQGESDYLRKLADAVDRYRSGELQPQPDPPRLHLLFAYLNHQAELRPSFPPTIRELIDTILSMGFTDPTDPRVVRRLASELGLETKSGKSGRPNKPKNAATRTRDRDRNTDPSA